MNGRTGAMLFVGIALLLTAMPAVAQSDHGTIGGAVLDSSGAALPGAELVLTNVDTGVVSRTTASEVGLYTLSSVPLVSRRNGDDPLRPGL